MHIEAGRHLYGGARQVLFIMQGLNKLGHKNILVCPTNTEIADAASTFSEVVPITLKGDLDIGLTARLIKVIRQYRPDIIHVHSRRGADFFGGIAARLTSTPCVLSRRVDNPERNIFGKIKYLFYDKVIAISSAIGRELEKQKVPKKNIRIIHSAVDAEFFDTHYDRKAFDKEFSIDNHQIVIGVIAQLIPRKGHRYLLNALPDILKKHANITVLFFGQGAEQQALEAEVSNKSLCQHVRFEGFRPDLPQWIGCLDIVVHPADMEGLGVSLLQAGAARVPMIGTNAGGIPEIILNRQTGLLIEPGDVMGLHNALLELIEDPSLGRELGLNANNHIKHFFSINSMVQGNLDVYEELIN